MKTDGFAWLFIVLFIILSGCGGTKLVRTSLSPELLKNQPKYNKYIKVHLKNGGLYVLNEWKISKFADTITGFGEYYNYKRDLESVKMKVPSAVKESTDRFSVLKDEITLIETNTLQNNKGNLAAITIIGVPTSLATIYCITNPKACFGSCPHFLCT